MIIPYFNIGRSNPDPAQRKISDRWLDGGISAFVDAVHSAWKITDSMGLPRTYYADSPGGTESERVVDFDQFAEALLCRDARVARWARSWRSGTAPLVDECAVPPTAYIGSYTRDPDLVYLRAEDPPAHRARVRRSLQPLLLHRVALDHTSNADAQQASELSRLQERLLYPMWIEGQWKMNSAVDTSNRALHHGWRQLVDAAFTPSDPSLYLRIEPHTSVVLVTRVPERLRDASPDAQHEWKLRTVGLWLRRDVPVVAEVERMSGMTLDHIRSLPDPA